MPKVIYPHQKLKKNLNEVELKRFNAYKKRECQRRIRYESINGRKHKNYYLHRCEVCRRFFEWVHFVEGYTVCGHCPANPITMKIFLERKKLSWKKNGDKTCAATKLLLPPTQQKTEPQTHDPTGTAPPEDEVDLFDDTIQKEFFLLYPLPPPFDYDEWNYHNMPFPNFSFKRG